jgi:basic membrane protein A
MKNRFPLAVALIGALALTACTGPATETPPEGQSDALRVAVILPGETTDQGFNATGEETIALLEDEFGADATLTESVNPAQQLDVYRQYAQQGYDLVVGWGGQFSDGAVAAAEEFPNTKFLVVSSGVENGSNLASYDTALEDWHFVGGYLMGKISKTGIVGQISGQCFASTASGQNGTRDGAKYANPDITWLATYTGDFEDPTKAQQAAQAMIDQGADVLATNLNQGVFGVVQAAKSNKGVKVVTEWLDNSANAPDAIISSVNKSYARFVGVKVQQIVDGTWKGDHQRFGLPADWGPAIFQTGTLSDELYEETLELQAKVASGEIDVIRDETCPG